VLEEFGGGREEEKERDGYIEEGERKREEERGRGECRIKL
jgi:hypothetical protein